MMDRRYPFPAQFLLNNWARWLHHGDAGAPRSVEHNGVYHYEETHPVWLPGCASWKEK